MPENTTCPGVQIKRNPGVTLLWTTREFLPFRESMRGDTDGILFKLGRHESHQWFCEGRTATRNEVTASIDVGYPILMKMARRGGPGDVEMLERMRSEFDQYLPK